MAERTTWRPFLEQWSAEWIAGNDPDKDAPLAQEVVRDAWLGFALASEAEVTAAEARLGRRCRLRFGSSCWSPTGGGTRATSSTGWRAPRSWNGCGTPTTAPGSRSGKTSRRTMSRRTRTVRRRSAFRRPRS
ncbi:hypothetical protein ACFQ51_43895 [Streptomyces kaempferi]